MSLYPSKGVDDLINDLNDLRKDQEFYEENLLNIKQKNLKLLQKALKAFSQDDGGGAN
jgi:hypothetical protein